MQKSIFTVTVLAGLFTLVTSYPADHREDTVLPFSLSPGNVNLETYYLNKYPQPEPPSRGNENPMMQQLPEEPIDNQNMAFLDDDEGFIVMSRAKREANPQHHHHHGHGHGHHHHHGYGTYHHQYPSYGHHHHNPYYNYYNNNNYNNYNPYHHHHRYHHHFGR